MPGNNEVNAAAQGQSHSYSNLRISLSCLGFLRQTSAVRASRRVLLILCFLILAVFANSINGAFVFDDLIHIGNNPRVRAPDSILAPLIHTTRPWVQGTLALNHAISGMAPWSYHIVNVLMHLGAALCLYGILRRLFARQLGEYSTGLSLTAAGLWAIHPLQTESVTYIIQRAEVGMGLCILLMLYALIRAAESSQPARWLSISALSCYAGYGFKPIMAIAPLLALVFDRCYISGSCRIALCSRRHYYLALWISPAVLIPLLASATGEWQATAGFSNDSMSWWQYARTQPEILLHYLRLTLWPSPLCLDYGWPVENRLWVIVITGSIVGALVLATIHQLRCRSPWGFLGFWFFVNLGPTSSFVPIVDLAFEHRMYLALAAPLTGLTLVGFALLRKVGAARRLHQIVAGAALAWAASFTVARNAEYQSAAGLLASNVKARPGYARPHLNLALELLRCEQRDLAVQQFEQAIRIRPDYAKAHVCYGRMLLEDGQFESARSHLEKGISLETASWETRMSLGMVYGRLGRNADAIEQFEHVLKLCPDAAGAHFNLGTLYERAGQRSKAVAHLQEAVRLAPAWPAPAQALQKLNGVGGKAP